MTRSRTRPPWECQEPCGALRCSHCHPVPTAGFVLDGRGRPVRLRPLRDGVDGTSISANLTGTHGATGYAAGLAHSIGAELRGEHSSGIYGTLSFRHFSGIETNDANCADSSGATLSDVRVGWQLERRDTIFEPFLGVRNWSRLRYNGSIRPNAFSIFDTNICRVIVPGRYYEPAPETELYVGVQVRFGL